MSLCKVAAPMNAEQEELRGCGCILPLDHNEEEHLSETKEHHKYAWKIGPPFEARRIHLTDYVEKFRRAQETRKKVI
jgi:hypothetical protein